MEYLLHNYKRLNKSSAGRKGSTNISNALTSVLRLQAALQSATEWPINFHHQNNTQTDIPERNNS